MLVRELKRPPLGWAEAKKHVRHRWALPFHALEWILDWMAYLLANWAFLEVLEYLGILSVLVAVVFYFSETGDRIKQKHYQAWQVINTAQGKGGNGGRIEAMQELNEDGQPLVGIDVAGAYLQGIRLPKANLLRSNLEAADVRDGWLRECELAWANLHAGNFRKADFERAHLENANLEDADLAGANLAEADLSGANFRNADLRNTDLRDIRWRGIQSISGAHVYGVLHAPADFLSWAREHGAVFSAGNDE